MNQTIDKIKALIAKDRLDDAIAQLEKLLKGKDSKAYNQIVVLSSRYQDYRSERLLGISHDKTERNRIAYSLTEICDEILKLEDFQKHKTKPINDSNSKKIKKGLAMKKKILKDFVIQNLMAYPHINFIKEPYQKFCYDKLIIRSIDDDTYPEYVETNEPFSPHFKTYPYDTYNDGIEIWLSGGVGENVFIDKNGFWQPEYEYGYGRKVDDNLEVIEAHCFGLLPYYNIEIFEKDGDDYSDGYPIFFCKYHNGSPFEDIIYRDRKAEFMKYATLDNNLRTKL